MPQPRKARVGASGSIDRPTCDPYRHRPEAGVRMTNADEPSLPTDAPVPEGAHPAPRREDAGVGPARGRRPTEPRRPRRVRPMLPLGGRGKVAVALLAACAVVALISAWSAWDLTGLLEEVSASEAAADDGGLPASTVSRLQVIEARESMLWKMSLALLVGTAIAFLVWFSRAHANLVTRRLPHLQHTAGWVIAGFFVPVVSLFQPCLVMNEVWRGSATLGRGGPAVAWRSTATSPWVLVWWLGWTASRIAGLVAARMVDGYGARSSSSLRTAMSFELASHVLEVVAAIVASWLILKISGFQDRAPADDGEALGEVFA